jgi:hypothetical protein
LTDHSVQFLRFNAISKESASDAVPCTVIIIDRCVIVRSRTCAYVPVSMVVRTMRSVNASYILFGYNIISSYTDRWQKLKNYYARRCGWDLKVVNKNNDILKITRLNNNRRHLKFLYDSTIIFALLEDYISAIIILSVELIDESAGMQCVRGEQNYSLW